MTPEEAKAALTFLNRCDLKGSEADAMATVKFKLMLIVQGKPVPRTGNVTNLVGRKGSSRGEECLGD